MLVGPLGATPTYFRWFAYHLLASSTDRFTFLTFWTLDFWGCLKPPRQNYSRWQLMPKCMLGKHSYSLVLLKFQASTIFFLSFTDGRKKWCSNFFEQLYQIIIIFKIVQANVPSNCNLRTVQVNVFKNLGFKNSKDKKSWNCTFWKTDRQFFFKWWPREVLTIYFKRLKISKKYC